MMFFDVVFFMVLRLWGWLNLLNPWVYSFYQIWGISGHYFFKFLFGSAFLLSLKVIFDWSGGSICVRICWGSREAYAVFILGPGTQGILSGAAVAQGAQWRCPAEALFPTLTTQPSGRCFMSITTVPVPAPPAPSQQWLPGGLRVGVFLPHPGWGGRGSGNIFPGEKAGGQASSSWATPVQLQPCLRYTRLNRSSSLTWGTPRWYMPGRVATSWSECLAGVKTWSDHLTPIFRTLWPGARKAEWAAASLCCLYASSAPCWILGVPSSSHPFPAGSQAASLTLLPPHHLTPL